MTGEHARHLPGARRVPAALREAARRTRRAGYARDHRRAADVVPGYRHVTGNHCGSTALRNLLAFHGARGERGAGVRARRRGRASSTSPSRGSRRRASRTAAPARLEENFLGSPARARMRHRRGPRGVLGARARAVDDGRPALLLTDLYYLDHYGNSAHFPGHAVVLAGYDDEVAYVSDTAFEELQTTRSGLAKARHEQHPSIRWRVTWSSVPGRGTAIRARRPRSDRGRAPRCTSRARRVRGAAGDAAPGGRDRRLAATPRDWQWCARFNYQVIERRGTGGGNFRRMYSRFLAEVGTRGAPWLPRPPSGGPSSPRPCSRPASRTSRRPALWSRVGAEAGRCRGRGRSGAALAAVRYALSRRQERRRGRPGVDDQPEAVRTPRRSGRANAPGGSWA